jgi:hypothetical protein
MMERRLGCKSGGPRRPNGSQTPRKNRQSRISGLNIPGSNLEQSLAMPFSKAAKAESERKGANRLSLVLHDLDRVKLKRAVTVEGTSLRSGLEGTVVLCHGSKAYEVEFDGIEDFFAMEPEVLEKI